MLLVGAVLLDPEFRAPAARRHRVPRLVRPDRRSDRAAARPSVGGGQRRVLRGARRAAARELPGVESAAVTLGLPLDPRARFFVDDSTFSIAGEPPQPIGQRPAGAGARGRPRLLRDDPRPAHARPLVRRSRSQRGRLASSSSTSRWRGASGRTENPIGRRITHDLVDRAGAADDARDRRRRRRRQALRPRTRVRAADVRAARADAVAVDGDCDPHAARCGAHQRRACGEAVWSVDATDPGAAAPADGRRVRGRRRPAAIPRVAARPVRGRPRSCSR